jgi:predicted NAD/FAD-dependent oxidoreductase
MILKKISVSIDIFRKKKNCFGYRFWKECRSLSSCFTSKKDHVGRRMHVIIGSGIAGSVCFHQNPDSVVYDKARFPGGRTSSKPLPNGGFCDLGATYFKSEVEIQKDKLLIEFQFSDWLRNLSLDPKLYQLDPHKSLYYLESGLQSIAQTLIPEQSFFPSHEVVSFQSLGSGGYEILFVDGSKTEAEFLTITAPLPQALSLFPENGVKSEWLELVADHNDYRKTLVAAAHWDQIPEALELFIANLDQKSFLYPQETAEYISIESGKSPGPPGSLCIMVQFSEEFSNQYFDDWRKVDRSPTNTCIFKFQESLRDFSRSLGEPNLVSSLLELEPDSYKVHKWRYAQAKNPLLGKSGILNLDDQKYKEYENLVQKSGIRITGDWLYGPRIERIAAGEIYARKFL